MPERLFAIAYLVGLGTGAVIRLRYIGPGRRETVLVSERSILERALLLLCGVGAQLLPVILVFTTWLDFADYRLPFWAGVCGVVLFALALVVLWRSHADLGRNWSPWMRVREEHGGWLNR